MPDGCPAQDTPRQRQHCEHRRACLGRRGLRERRPNSRLQMTSVSAATLPGIRRYRPTARGSSAGRGPMSVVIYGSRPYIAGAREDGFCSRRIGPPLLGGRAACGEGSGSGLHARCPDVDGDDGEGGDQEQCGGHERVSRTGGERVLYLLPGRGAGEVAGVLAG